MRKGSWARDQADAGDQPSWVALLYMKSFVSRSLRRRATNLTMEPFSTREDVEAAWCKASECSTKAHGPGPKEQARLPSSRSTTLDTFSQPVIHSGGVPALTQRGPRAQPSAPHPSQLKTAGSATRTPITHLRDPAPTAPAIAPPNRE